MFKHIHDLENQESTEDGGSKQSQFTIESFDRMFYLLHNNTSNGDTASSQELKGSK